jgi:TonB-dependent SusC/RagA subfamily outer membrane receptor
MLFPTRGLLAKSAVLVATLACAAAQSGSPQTSRYLVTEADIASGEPIEVIIQRKVPGVVATRTSDGGIALQVRGATSFGNVENRPPLYVLNGLPLQPGGGGTLQGVNPLEIESIKVLKGPEAGMYGIDGANGVIVVTTKTGRRP